MSSLRRTRLKGGSLSGTYLMEEAGRTWVRKEVSLTENREYGFVRWHSQLKRLQRFGELFPGIFPRVLEVGREGTRAYFDLEFIEGSRSGFELLRADPPESEVQAYFRALVAAMDRLHAVRRPSSPRALDLYLYEEMERPLDHCAEDPTFKAFLAHPTVVFNGTEIPSLVRRLPDLYRLGTGAYRVAWECYTHGNLTLENTLWVPAEGRVWFIDPYEENIADTVYNEYSQVLQSCHSRYELYNELEPRVEGHRVSAQAADAPGLARFDGLFEAFLQARLSPEEQRLVRLYELTQFTRMLPFKLQIAPQKLAFFYALASLLAHQLLEGTDG
jgi:hypothetical protein